MSQQVWEFTNEQMHLLGKERGRIKEPEKQEATGSKRG